MNLFYIEWDFLIYLRLSTILKGRNLTAWFGCAKIRDLKERESNKESEHYSRMIAYDDKAISRTICELEYTN